MNKLFQTLFVLLAISSQATAVPVKASSNIDANKLLPFSQANRKNSHSKNLAGLYRINSFQSSQINQPHREFNQLYLHAQEGQNELEAMMQFIASSSNTQTVSSGIKSKQRALNKINSKFAGNCEQITDIARTSIVAKDVPSLMSAFERIEDEAQIVRIKNRFKEPRVSGYRDLSLLVRLPESKIVAEVQLHLEAFSDIKHGDEHKNYEKIQYIERKQHAENRALSEFELASIDKLRKQSQQMYKNVWSQYLSA